MSVRLAGQVAIITGSTSGLGRATALRFASEGADVVVTGRNAERARAVLDDIKAAGGRGEFVAADLALEESCAQLVAAAVQHFGKLTVLVNNAVSPEAIAKDRKVTELSEASLKELLQVNLIGPAILCKHAIPAMITTGGGSIVNVGAVSGARGTPGLTGYSMSKGGLAALTRVVATEYGDQGIRCNTVQAGFIIHRGREPEMTDERVAELEKKQLTRLAEADDVARAIAFLASPEADVITGATIAVDGGSTVFTRKP
jgi:NAD(P)-dependent dehydrogenase (short-subunit alcohol dehydrogenase family)